MRRAVVASVLLLASVSLANAQVGVSPPILELTLGSRPAPAAFRFFNLTDRTLDVRVTVRNWDLDENNQVRVLPPDEQSLDQWIILQPGRFTVPPGKSQALRIEIRPRVKPAPGEHRAMIYFEEVPPAHEPPSKAPFRVYFRLGAAVYAYAGEIRTSAKLNCIDADATGLAFDISSLGNAHVRLHGQYAVWPAARYPGAGKTPYVEGKETAAPSGVFALGSFPDVPVLGGTRRVVRGLFAKPLAPGDYVLDLNGSLADLKLVFGVPFTVPVSASPPAAGTAKPSP